MNMINNANKQPEDMKHVAKSAILSLTDEELKQVIKILAKEAGS